MRIAVLPVALLLALTACGSSGDADVPDAGGRTDLTVVVSSGYGDERTWTLRCDPPGGDHPDPEAACRLLDRLDHPFAPLRPDRMCTEIYGGPQTARVTGTFRGEPVDARFKRTDGCEISRWDAYVDLLVERGGAGAA